MKLTTKQSLPKLCSNSGICNVYNDKSLTISNSFLTQRTPFHKSINAKKFSSRIYCNGKKYDSSCRVQYHSIPQFHNIRKNELEMPFASSNSVVHSHIHLQYRPFSLRTTLLRMEYDKSTDSQWKYNLEERNAMSHQVESMQDGKKRETNSHTQVQMNMDGYLHAQEEMEEHLHVEEEMENSFEDSVDDGRSIISHQVSDRKENITKMLSKIPKHIYNEIPHSAFEMFHSLEDERIVKSIVYKNVWSLAPIPSYYSEGEIRQWLEASFNIKSAKIVHLQRSYHARNTWLMFLQNNKIFKEKYDMLAKNASYRNNTLDVIFDEVNDYKIILQEIRMWLSFKMSQNKDKIICIFVKLNKRGRMILNTRQKSDASTLSNIRSYKSVKKEIQLDMDVAYHLHKLLGYPPVVKTLMTQEGSTSISKSLSNNFSSIDNCHRLLVLCKSPEDAWSLLARLAIQPIIEKSQSYIEVVYAEKW